MLKKRGRRECRRPCLNSVLNTCCSPAAGPQTKRPHAEHRKVGTMEKVLTELDRWFLAKENEVKVFAQNDSRLEGWFKGEMLILLDRLKRQSIISWYNREASLYSGGKRHQVDFELKIGEARHLVELKAPCISQAQGTPRNLNFYFSDGNMGLFTDMRKLNGLDTPNKWLIAFIYPRPSDRAWTAAVTRVPRDLAHWHCLTKIDAYPSHLFISVWKG